MKMRKRFPPFLASVIAVTLALCACSQQKVAEWERPATTPAVPTAEETTSATSVIIPTGESYDDVVLDAPYISDLDYSILLSDTAVALQDWDDRISFRELLGREPDAEKVTRLEHADTLTGSYLKEISYPGMNIVLFSPKQNGETFWIMEIILTNDTYATVKGLHVGMDVEDLKAVYPDIRQEQDGRTDSANCAYVISDSNQYKNARYEVTDGVITEIRLFAEIP